MRAEGSVIRTSVDHEFGHDPRWMVVDWLLNFVAVSSLRNVLALSIDWHRFDLIPFLFKLSIIHFVIVLRQRER